MHCNADHHCDAPFSDLIWWFPEHYVEGCDIKMLLKDWTKLECAPLTLICTVERVKRKRGYKQGSDKELPRTDTKRRGLNPTLGVVRTLRCIALDCVAADRMGVGQMEREDFLPSTGCHN